jgi:membrane protein DedA with SNARE-associated domain
MDLQAVIEWALAGLAAYGYPIVFAATLLENVFVIGSFVPGDMITAAAAVAAATNPAARLSPIWLIAIGTFGSVLGANISYVVGYRGGRELIERVGPRFGIDVKAIEAAEEFFGRRGSETIFLARFVAVIKNVIPALAGASRMSLFWFELYSFLSALVYAGVIVGVGWFLGDNFRVGLKYFGAFSWLLFVAVVAGAVALTLAKRKRDKRLIAKEAAAFEQEHAEQHERDRR